MSGSLQDQLLKAGLVSEKQLKKAEADKKSRKLGAKGKRKPKKQRDEGVSLAKAYAERARMEQSERDRELNRKREEEKKRRELNARMKQIVVPAAQNKPDAELSRFFEWHEKIRKVFVTKEQQAALNEGRLGIVHHGGRFYIVGAEVVEKVREIKPDCIGFFAPDHPDDDQGDYDDPRFQVPDDLIW